MDTPRREVLAAAVTGSTLGLAGCGDLAGLDNSATEQTDDGEGATSDNGRTRITIALAVQEAIQEAREEIGARVQEGNLSQEDGQAEFRDTREEIVSTAIEDVRMYAADAEGFTVENTNELSAAVLVSGPAVAVLDTLNADIASALLSASDFPEPQEDG